MKGSIGFIMKAIYCDAMSQTMLQMIDYSDARPKTIINYISNQNLHWKKIIKKYMKKEYKKELEDRERRYQTKRKKVIQIYLVYVDLISHLHGKHFMGKMTMMAPTTSKLSCGNIKPMMNFYKLIPQHIYGSIIKMC